MTPIDVLALVPYPVGRVPGQRYRIEQWAPHMRASGVHVTFSPFLSSHAMDVFYRRGHTLRKLLATLQGYARRTADLRRVSRFDVVYIYREAAFLGPALLERLVARRAPIVFDFDDAIYLAVASPANAWIAHLKSANKTPTLCGLARHVTVGNAHLAEYARRRGAHVTVIPSTIDTDTYTPATRPANARPVIGWTGSSTTAPHLLTIASAMARLRERIDFQLRVIGAEVEMPGVDVQCLAWRPETEVEDLRALDVGLMPLPDDEWSRGKCAMKALQYMALGIPPVVSPIGANSTVVRDGVSGLHARSEAEWISVVERLLRDPELRARLGAEARRTVEGEYSASIQAPRMATVLRQSVRQRSGTEG